MHLITDAQEESQALAIKSEQNQLTTATVTTNNPPKTRFVGKHSKDQKLSVFIQKRNINECQQSGQVEEIMGLVRVSPDAYSSILQKESSKWLSNTVVFNAFSYCCWGHG